jgi:lipooligosaccharide transport system permease protein
MPASALVLPVVARRVERRAAFAVAVMGRNAAAARHFGYWWVLFSGFFEPLLYLLSIGYGVGGLVGDFRLADGRIVTYAAFVAPAMLASSAMNGAIAESTFNFFDKMKYMRLYDAVIATPVTPIDIAIGELLWAMLRGAVYSAAFLTVMTWMDLTTPWWALASIPATMAVWLSFGADGMMLSTFVRTWQDFDYVMVTQFALFLFSGTFAPVNSFPLAMRIAVEVTPLYHGVEVVRSLTTGVLGWSMLWHLAYLAALTAIGLRVAARRMNALLCK